MFEAVRTILHVLHVIMGNFVLSYMIRHWPAGTYQVSKLACPTNKPQMHKQLTWSSNVYKFSCFIIPIGIGNFAKGFKLIVTLPEYLILEV